MRTLRTALLCLIALTAQAQAQDAIPLRSGEHPTFTRLVLDTLPQQGWQARQTGRDVSVSLPATGPVSTRNVFDRIPRTRLLSVEAFDGEIMLRLGCACPVQVFELEGRALVIDIRDPGSDGATDTADLAPIRATPPMAEPDPPARDVVVEGVESPARPAPPAGRDLPADPDLSDVRNRLIEQLTRAADQGLLQLADTAPAPVDAPAEEPQEETISEPATVDPARDAVEPPVTPIAQVSIRTAFEAPQEPIRSTDRACAFPVPVSAGPERERFLRYTALQSDIYGEFDTVSEGHLRELVLTAIGLGFGQEAQAILRQNRDVLQEHAILLDLARIVDGAQPGTALQDLVECDGIAGLWARLTTQDRDIASRFADADLETLSDLDPDHRLLLVERAADHWLDLSMHATAQRAVELGIRTGIAPPAPLRLIAARIAIRRGDVDAALSELAELAESSSLTGLRAGITLAEVTLARDMPLDPGLELDLAATAFQLRGTQTGRAAIGLLAAVRARDGNLSRSLQMLEESARREPDMAPIWRRVAADLIETTPADRPDYARAVLRYQAFLPDGTAGDMARVAAARGLRDLGLPTEAKIYAASAADRGNPVATELIRSLEVPDSFPPAPQLAAPSPRPQAGLAGASELIATGEVLRISASQLLDQPEPD